MDWCEISNVLNLGVSGDHLRKTAYGLMEYDEYIHGFNGIATTILSISDLHVPYNLDVSIFKSYVGKIDVLQINGDIVDCQSLSKFPKLYRISPMEEIIKARNYIIELIEFIKPKKVVVNWGNHDKRFSAYFAKNLDTDILELMPDTSLDLIFVDGFNHYDKRTKSKTWYEPLINLFDDVEIEYNDDWKSKIGKTWFVHPMAFKSGTLATCEKAMDYLHRTEKESFDCVVMAHTHAIGDTKKGFIRLFEQGACCDVKKMDYMDGRLSAPQKMGFVIICQNSNGDIINNRSRVVEIE